MAGVIKIRGEIIRLSNADGSMVEWFHDINSAEDIRRSVDSILQANKQQVADRYRKISSNEIIIFKSFDRNIASVVLIGSVECDTQNDGYSSVQVMVNSDVKLIKHQAEVQSTLINENKYYADTLVGYFDRNNANELYFDFLNRKVFDRSELVKNDRIGLTHWVFAR